MDFPPDQQIPITLEAQQWDFILRCLMEAPYRLAAPIIARINQQMPPPEVQQAISKLSTEEIVGVAMRNGAA